jgi:uncharacterized protein
MIKALVLLVVMIASPWASATSFDCRKAATDAEKTVCGSALLGKLDDALSTNYRNMLTGDLGDGGKDLKREQKEWMHKRNACKSEKCLVDAYRSRVDEICNTAVVTGVHPDCVMSDDVR